MYLPTEIIAAKRSGEVLNKAQIQQFITGIVDGSFRDYQASALLMAIVLKGMSAEETAHMTAAMMRSGRMIELPEIARPKIDKHSTGGVGDKVSLILAPIAAALGLCVPMISGRGLGHTGGTLDKLESIPGFQSELSESAYRAQLQKIHLAIIGQSSDMVPADRILYSLRDVTATVESVPLIVSSILSKKLAAGIDGLVLDVKCGRGAFMQTEADARELANAMMSICHHLGKPARALITRMDQPLGYAVGNSLEVIESIECLKGNGPEDLMSLTRTLAAHMMLLGGLCNSLESCVELVDGVIADGSALAAFAEMVSAQNGMVEVIEDYGRLPSSTGRAEVVAQAHESGYVCTVDALAIGRAVHLLGAGRSHASDTVDPAVGIILNKKVGDRVQIGDSLAQMHFNDSGKLFAVEELIRSAFKFGTDLPSIDPVLIDTVYS